MRFNILIPFPIIAILAMLIFFAYNFGIAGLAMLVGLLVLGQIAFH